MTDLLPDLGDLALSRIYRERVVAPRRARVSPLIERGIARGDLRADTDIQLLHELLLGLIMYWLMLGGEPLDRDVGTRLVDVIVPGFATRRRSARTRWRFRH